MFQEDPPIPTVVEWMESCDEFYDYVHDKIKTIYTNMDPADMCHYDGMNKITVDGNVIKAQLLQRLEFNHDYEKSLMLKIMNNHPSLVELLTSNKCTFKNKTIEIDSWQQGIDDVFTSPSIKLLLMSLIKDILTEGERTFSNPSLIIFETILGLFNKVIIDAIKQDGDGGVDGDDDGDGDKLIQDIALLDIDVD